MAVDQDDLERIIASIERAPFTEHGWEEALAGAVRVGGGWGVQMIAQTATGEVHFDIGVNIDPEIIETYEERGTSNPLLSPRSAAALYTRPLDTFCESDFITPEERARHPMYQEVHLPYNAAYVCGARLHNHRDLLTGLGVLRSERQGHTTKAERRAFHSIVPHLDAAFRLQMQLETQAAVLAQNAFEAMALPAIICDAQGRVTSLSSQAQAIVAANDYLTIRGRRLVTRDAESQRRLDDALALLEQAPRSAQARITALPLLGTGGDVEAFAEIAPLPRSGLFGLGCALVLIKPAPGAAPALRRAFGLTAAEVEIARLAMRAGSAAEIARRRGTSVETVRSQLRAIYAKLGVRSRTEMILRIQAT